MIFQNARIFTPGGFISGGLAVEGERIVSAAGAQGEKKDCRGKVILPGFIDIHIHGCNAADATDLNADSPLVMSAYLASKGVTSFCPTTMTLPPETLEKAFGIIAAAMGKEPGAYIQGVNMEGPFISREKKGAQAGEYITPPSCALVRKLDGICPVKIIDIAPEAEGAEQFIKEMSPAIRISLAHTAAVSETVKKAERAGLSHATHLFNAMTGMTARNPGAAGAVLDSDKITAELICDGIHVSPEMLRLAFRTLGESRTVIISDAMMAAGLGEGEYTLGGQKVIKTDAARLEDGTLAGSVANLFDELRYAISIGIPETQAIKSVTENPAKVIGVFGETGSLEEGKYADLVILSPDMSRIEEVYVKGRPVFTA